MPRVLVLDDDDARHTVFSQILSGCEVLHVHTAWEACRALQQSAPFDLACLDHDLGMFGPGLEEGFDADAGTGTDVAEFIANHLDPTKYPKRIIIHSWNPAGVRRMRQALWPTRIPVTAKEFSAGRLSSAAR